MTTDKLIDGPKQKRTRKQTAKTFEKQIEKALKASLIESGPNHGALASIEEMRTFSPTEEEFASPLVYIDKLIKEADIMRFGCVKIIPPASFKPALALDLDSEVPLITRYQVLSKLSTGQGFTDNEKGRTFRELERMSAELEAFSVEDDRG